MKQMTYCKNYITEVLHQGEYKNHRFAIINIGPYPVAYVSTELNIEDLTDRLLENVKAHNGFFSYGKSYWDDSEEQYLGWDYNGITDYYGGLEGTTSISVKFLRRWTTEEIFKDVKEVITQLDDLEQKEDLKEERRREFCAIIDWLTAGGKVRRKSWPKHVYICDDGDYIMIHDDEFDTDKPTPYLVSAYELEATDWEFYEQGDNA